MTGLADRPVLVTGAASGIGRATCARLAAEGALVALLDRDAGLLATVADELRARGATALALTADVSREADVAAAVERAAAELGGLRGVVTSAGIFRPGDYRPLAEVDLETFTRTLAVNLTGTFLAVKLALPHLLRAGGAVVTVASTAALRGHGIGSGYTASKGGVVALTRLLAFQYGERGVRANCICPGATAPPMTGGVYRDPERARQVSRGIPLRRVAEPDEIGNAICYLLSDDASYVNGQVIAVDGGASVV
jgi:3-oxoacyl-[acyl-carrier protein] reductase